MSVPTAFAMHRARRAVTLIEAVLFISIALALIVGGLVFYRQATIALQTQETVRLLQAIVVEARVLWRYSGNEPYDPNDPYKLQRVLHAAGAIPSTAWDAASGTIRSPWGEKIYISSRDPGGNLPGTMVWVSFYDQPFIPREICARIAVFDGSTTNGALGDGIAYIDMNVFLGYGSAAFAPSDKYLAAYPGVAGSTTHFGGLTPATAGEACKRFEDQYSLLSIGHMAVGFWFQS